MADLKNATATRSSSSSSGTSSSDVRGEKERIPGPAGEAEGFCFRSQDQQAEAQLETAPAGAQHTSPEDHDATDDKSAAPQPASAAKSTGKTTAKAQKLLLDIVPAPESGEGSYAARYNKEFQVVFVNRTRNNSAPLDRVPPEEAAMAQIEVWNMMSEGEKPGENLVDFGTPVLRSAQKLGLTSPNPLDQHGSGDKKVHGGGIEPASPRTAAEMQAMLLPGPGETDAISGSHRGAYRSGETGATPARHGGHSKSSGSREEGGNRGTISFQATCEQGSLGMGFVGRQVTSVDLDTPNAWAAQNGVRRFDEITEVNGRSVDRLQHSELADFLKGTRPLTVTFVRQTIEPGLGDGSARSGLEAGAADPGVAGRPEDAEDRGQDQGPKTSPTTSSSSSSRGQTEKEALSMSFREMVQHAQEASVLDEDVGTGEHPEGSFPAAAQILPVNLFDHYPQRDFLADAFTENSWKAHGIWRGCFVEEELLPVSNFVYGRSYFKSPTPRDLRTHTNNFPLVGSGAAASSSAVRWPEKQHLVAEATSAYSPASITSSAADQQASVQQRIALEAQTMQRPPTRIPWKLAAYEFLLFFATYREAQAEDVHLLEPLVWKMRLLNKLATMETSWLASWNLGVDRGTNYDAVAVSRDDAFSSAFLGNGQVDLGSGFVLHGAQRLVEMADEVGRKLVVKTADGEQRDFDEHGTGIIATFEQEDNYEDETASDASASSEDRERKTRALKGWVKRKLHFVEDALEDCLTADFHHKRYAEASRVTHSPSFSHDIRVVNACQNAQKVLASTPFRELLPLLAEVTAQVLPAIDGRRIFLKMLPHFWEAVGEIDPLDGPTLAKGIVKLSDAVCGSGCAATGQRSSRISVGTHAVLALHAMFRKLFYGLSYHAEHYAKTFESFDGKTTTAGNASSSQQFLQLLEDQSSLGEGETDSDSRRGFSPALEDVDDDAEAASAGLLDSTALRQVCELYYDFEREMLAPDEETSSAADGGGITINGYNYGSQAGGFAESSMNFLSKTGGKLATSAKMAFFGGGGAGSPRDQWTLQQQGASEGGHINDRTGAAPLAADATSGRVQQFSRARPTEEFGSSDEDVQSGEGIRGRGEDVVEHDQRASRRGVQGRSQQEGTREKTHAAGGSGTVAASSKNASSTRTREDFEVFYETAYRAVASADLRDMLVLCLKDYRRTCDPEGVPLLLRLFAIVSDQCQIRLDALPIAANGDLPQMPPPPLQRPRGHDQRATANRERTPSGSGRWHFYCYLVWSAGTAQSERLLRPLRQWQLQSAHVFEQMVSVQKFMNELADAVKSLKEEIACDDRYYADGWDAVFDPAASSCTSHSTHRHFSVHIILDALRHAVRDVLHWVAGEKIAGGGGPHTRSWSCLPSRRPWNVASEEELPPSGGKVVWSVHEFERAARPWIIGMQEVDGLLRSSSSSCVYYHFPESLNGILEPLVNVAIVSRFQQFDQVIISKCLLGGGTDLFRPMRPPGLLHSTAVLDLWNFVFSAFDAVRGFQIPLHLCVGVFCNFVHRTLCQFAERMTRFGVGGGGGAGGSQGQVGQQQQVLNPDIFPLYLKAKRVYADIRLPENDDVSSENNSSDVEPGQVYSGRGELGASPERGGKYGAASRVSGASPERSRLSWLSRNAPARGAASRKNSKPPQTAGGSRPPSRYRFSLSRRKTGTEFDRPVASLLSQARIQVLEKDLPPMSEIVVRIRSLAFCATQLRVLLEHVADMVDEAADADAMKMLEEAITRCREATILPAIESLVGYLCAQMVHLELGKALYVSLYATVGVVGGASQSAQGSGAVEQAGDGFYDQGMGANFGQGAAAGRGAAASGGAQGIGGAATAWGYVVVHLMRQGTDLAAKPIDVDADYLIGLARQYHSFYQQQAEGGLLLNHEPQQGTMNKKIISPPSPTTPALEHLDAAVTTAQRLQILLHSGIPLEDLKALAWQFGESTKSADPASAGAGVQPLLEGDPDNALPPGGSGGSDLDNAPSNSNKTASGQRSATPSYRSPFPQFGRLSGAQKRAQSVDMAGGGDGTGVSSEAAVAPAGADETKQRNKFRGFNMPRNIFNKKKPAAEQQNLPPP
eukprot:g5614.t1